MLQLQIQGEKKKDNSENVLQEVVQQMFEITARTLNTGLRVFPGNIDDTLQHRTRNSVNFTHYIRLQIRRSYCWRIHLIFEISP